MAFTVLRYVVFIAMFGFSFYAISAIQFDKICSVKQPSRVIVLMFLLSFIFAYISTEAILSLTIYSGIGG